MGITASYLALPPEDYVSLESDLEAAEEFFYGMEDFDAMDQRREEEKAQGRRLSIEKDWHAIHYLLTGDPGMEEHVVPPPLGNVVLGGTPTPFEATYGQVRLLKTVEVQEVNDALAEVTLEELKSRFDKAAFNRHEIYPNPRPGGWDDHEISTVWFSYPSLCDFFGRAVVAGHVVLLSLD